VQPGFSPKPAKRTAALAFAVAASPSPSWCPATPSPKP
jgi:hypothetical protein